MFPPLQDAEMTRSGVVAASQQLTFGTATVRGALMTPGHYQFTDPRATNNVRRFYRVRWP
jgi:hypothetical protein